MVVKSNSPVKPGFESASNNMARSQGISMEKVSAMMASKKKVVAKKKKPHMMKAKGV